MEEVRRRGAEEKQIFYANFESQKFEELKKYKAFTMRSPLRPRLRMPGCTSSSTKSRKSNHGSR